MDDEFNIEDNLTIFNANFECDDEEKIKYLYKTKKTIENNDIISKKIVKEKYNHPLFLNYNYCLFCLERRKTKYNHKNLNDIHNITTIKTIAELLEKENIKLQIPKNKIEKLSKRRFIHSCEHIQKNIIEIKKYKESDTELYIEKNNKIGDNSHSINMLKKIRTTIDTNKNLKSFNSNKNIKKSSKLLSPKFDKKHFENEEQSEDDPKKTNTFKKNSSTFQRKSFSKKSVRLHQIKKFSGENGNEEGENIFINSSNQIRDSKLKKTKSFNLFGFITDYFYNDKENTIKNTYMEQINETDLQSFQYFEKNDKCGICLGEIKDKFTLFCGDFFCRECIINLIEESINNIAMFDKIECPRCHESINESTIKFLLKKEYLKKYNKIKTKTDGLKNKNNVPCPHPDCEGFALKEEEINGTLQCQKGHIFCHKCLEEIPQKYRLEPNNVHICINKYEETEKFLKHNKNIRKCPQCKSWVQREPGGCNFFRCSNIWCKYEFCWICGKKYEPSHYRNPLSMCFGLSDSNYQGKMVKSARVRTLRCILIALLFILILLPIIIIFFSFFLIFSFIMYFQFDGKELRNVRFHSKSAHKIFYYCYFLFIIFISIGLIPFGYICLVLLILAIPIFIIINKIKKKKAMIFNYSKD